MKTTGGSRTERPVKVHYGPADTLVPIVSVGVLLALGTSLVEQAAAFIGFVGLAFGLVIFFKNGGRRVTAAGLFGLGYTVFIAGASLYWLSEGSTVDDSFLAVQVVTLLAMWAMEILFWRRLTPPAPALQVPLKDRYLIITVAAVVILVLLVLIIATGDTFVKRLAAGAVALMMIVLCLPNKERRLSIAGLILASLVFFWFFETFFNGFGRLVLVSIALSVLVAVSTLISRAWIKSAVVLAVIPAILALASVRDNMETASGDELDGLGSVVNPFMVMVELFQHLSSDAESSLHVSTFFAVVLFWVPRVLWEDKPIAFGRELVYLLRPELSNTNHSMASLYTGEWVYGFGIIGFVLMIFVLGVGVHSVDRVISWSISDSANVNLRILLLAGAAFIAGQMPTLVWSGMFSPTSRSVQGLLPIVLVMGTCELLSRSSEQGVTKSRTAL